MQYPRPVRDIHQIEVTTRCNLKCHYCPHYPNLPRPKIDMSWDTWLQAMDLVHFYVKQGTQTELSLTGIGESMLHPRFPEMVEQARMVIGPQRMLTVTTNGLLLDEEMAKALFPFKPSIFVSLHRPEKAAIAMRIAKKYGLLAGRNTAFADSAFDWAGYQKNWTEQVCAPKIQCEYLRSGWGVILVDGRITTCCLDAECKPQSEGGGVFGSLANDPGELMMQPWDGCKKCHMEVP